MNEKINPTKIDNSTMFNRKKSREKLISYKVQTETPKFNNPDTILTHKIVKKK